MSKTVSRDKDPKTSGPPSSSSRAKPGSSSQSHTSMQLRIDNKGISSQSQGSFVITKPAESTAANPKSGPHDMRAHEWKNFFVDTGIPDHAALEYANIFVKERINWQILKNLDKAYLKDMDIHCVGDQIAILQAAKKYCGEQYTPGQSKPILQGAMRMDVEETQNNGSPVGILTAPSRPVEAAPEKVTVLSTISRLSPKKAVRNEVTSTTAVRSILQNPRNPGESTILLRGKRSADDEDSERFLKKISNQPARQVRQLPPDDTNFTVRLGSGISTKRGDVFSRLSQKSLKATNNTNLVRVLETRMSRLSTGPTSTMPSNGSTKSSLVSDSLDSPTPVFRRLGSGNASSRAHSVPNVNSSGSSVFSRLGYQSKPKNGTSGDSRIKVSVHDRLGTRR